MDSFKIMAKTFNIFEIVIQGERHHQYKENCQDHAFSNVNIGIVSDGVGSLPYSEFTSFLLSSSVLKFLSEIDFDEIKDKKDVEIYLLNEISDHIRYTKDTCFYFLRDEEKIRCDGATLIFYIITPEYTYIFSQGDGYYGINDDIYKVEGNHNYIDFCTLKFEQKIETEKVDKIWVSTDGLRYSSILMDKLMNGTNMNDLEDVIREEEKLGILRDDLGMVISWR